LAAKKDINADCLRELERTYLLAKHAYAVEKRLGIQKKLKILNSPGGIARVAKKAAATKVEKKPARTRTQNKKTTVKQELLFPSSRDNGGPESA
jgi:hypothetical protein